MTSIPLLSGHQRTTTRSPHIRGFWDGERISVILVLALLPPLITDLALRGIWPAFLILLSVATVLAWQGLFAWARGRTLGWEGLVVALTFPLLLPTSAPVWQVILAMSFGVVVGEQMFGGRGRNFLNPTVVALAFLIFSFPGAGYENGSAPPAISALPGAILLLVTRIVSWRVALSAVLAILIFGYLLGMGDPLAEIAAGAFAFGLVFLACDPVSAASTNPGRWAYGILVGGLTVLGRTSGVGDGTVFAILIASLFAPLIDQGAVYANVWWRERRYGRP